MLLKNNLEDEEVFQFLGSNFHQDTFYEEALQELLEEAPKEYLEDAIIFLTEFIQSNYSDKEKNEYIQYSTDGIYFEGLEITPLEWLEQTVKTVKHALKNT
ncbi:contact-dependent growth inhibition system immunity protein [Bacillus sp. BP-3]|uniref:contact-dependent growth inhibition system immunity protein n=1 Tax=Bacillus sp. BP-3 TaxID=3022773 RepID=UPI00232DED54|nr:contact-dependent growth inhibition system immunity protein [Bacillus sp. BP-3]MDC2864223.1 contact-dependent growth inhibition system immunity protein [Bacillus sp. BP-3]